MVPGLMDGLPAFDDIEHQWLFDPLPTTDQQDEASAGKIMLSTGQVMPSELYARRGKDYDTEIRRGAVDYGVDEDTLRAAHFAESFPAYHGVKIAEAKPMPGNDGAATRPQDEAQFDQRKADEAPTPAEAAA